MNRSNKPPTKFYDDTYERGGHGRNVEEEKQETVQEDQEEQQEREEAPVTGAYAVNRDGVVPRAGRNPDSVTLMSEPESIDASSVVTPGTRNQSELLVQAQLAQVTDEEVARLQEENILLRRSIPLAQAQVAEPFGTPSDDTEHHVDSTASNSKNDVDPNDEEKKLRYNCYIIGGVAVLVIAVIVGVVVGVKPWDNGGGSGEQSMKESTGLVMSLIGLEAVFDKADSDLWATVSKEYIEDFYNSRRRRLLRSLPTTIIHNVETALEVTDTSVVKGGSNNNGTDSSLVVTYAQSIMYRFEEEDVSIDYLVTEPFRTSSRRMAYVDGLQDAGVAQGENVFDNLAGVSMGSTTPNPSSPYPTNTPTQDLMSPPSTLAPTPTLTAPSTQELTRSPTVDPTSPPTAAPTTPSPTQASTVAPATLAPTQAPMPLPPNVTWNPVGQVLHGKAANDFFGRSVCLSRDGMVMAVGAKEMSSDPGYVSVHRYNQATKEWMNVGQELVGQADNDKFGNSVSLNGDGTILAVGAPRGGSDAGHVRVFEYSPLSDGWVLLGSDIIKGQSVGGGRFGWTVSLSDDGGILSVGALSDDTENAEDSGSVRMFEYNHGTSSWKQLGQTLIGQVADDNFGLSVSLSRSGSIVGVGANLDDSGGRDAGQVSVYEYNFLTLRWDPLGSPINGQVEGGWLGSSVSLDDSGLIVAVGAHGTSNERVVVYANDRKASSWNQQGQTLFTTQEDDKFGWSVSLSGNGDVLAVGSYWHNVNTRPRAGQVAIFQYDTNSAQWNQVGYPLNGATSSESFGYSVALSADGSLFAVGAHRRGSWSGSAYVFTATKT